MKKVISAALTAGVVLLSTSAVFGWELNAMSSNEITAVEQSDVNLYAFNSHLDNLGVTLDNTERAAVESVWPSITEVFCFGSDDVEICLDRNAKAFREKLKTLKVTFSALRTAADDTSTDVKVKCDSGASVSDAEKIVCIALKIDAHNKAIAVLTPKIEDKVESDLADYVCAKDHISNLRSDLTKMQTLYATAYDCVKEFAKDIAKGKISTEDPGCFADVISLLGKPECLDSDSEV